MHPFGYLREVYPAYLDFNFSEDDVQMTVRPDKGAREITRFRAVIRA
jgi:hypothetical protein